MSDQKQSIQMKTERQLELLKRKIQELTNENQILREINVKLQIENFNLQKKLENRQEDEDLEDPTEKPEAEIADNQDKLNYYEVLYTNDSENMTTEEYLEDQEQQEEVETYENPVIAVKLERPIHIIEPKRIKRRCTKEFDENEILIEKPLDKISKRSFQSDQKYQISSNNSENEEIILEDEESDEIDSNEISPVDAMAYVYKIAAKYNMVPKLDSIDMGKHKDSAFVSKVLDLFFDKITLATSTAQGQKCQSKLHLPAKPALHQGKMDICMKAFTYRLMQESLDESEMQSRMKLFNKLVNDKIQNCRKCLTRMDASKLLEA